jgi:hypothetical protein
MKIIVNKNDGQSYTGNILFRVYEALGNDNLYAFEILCKPGFTSKYRGQYTCEHPQAAQDILEKVLQELRGPSGGILEISNELHNNPPSHDHDWFDAAIQNALAGNWKYN